MSDDEHESAHPDEAPCDTDACNTASDVMMLVSEVERLRAALRWIADQFCTRAPESDGAARVCGGGECVTEYCLSCYALACLEGGPTCEAWKENERLREKLRHASGVLVALACGPAGAGPCEHLDCARARAWLKEWNDDGGEK